MTSWRLAEAGWSAAGAPKGERRAKRKIGCGKDDAGERVERSEAREAANRTRYPLDEAEDQTRDVKRRKRERKLQQEPTQERRREEVRDLELTGRDEVLEMLLEQESDDRHDREDERRGRTGHVSVTDCPEQLCRRSHEQARDDKSGEDRAVLQVAVASARLVFLSGESPGDLVGEQHPHRG